MQEVNRQSLLCCAPGDQTSSWCGQCWTRGAQHCFFCLLDRMADFPPDYRRIMVIVKKENSMKSYNHDHSFISSHLIHVNTCLAHQMYCQWNCGFPFLESSPPHHGSLNVYASLYFFMNIAKGMIVCQLRAWSRIKHFCTLVSFLLFFGTLWQFL